MDKTDVEKKGGKKGRAAKRSKFLNSYALKGVENKGEASERDGGRREHSLTEPSTPSVPGSPSPLTGNATERLSTTTLVTDRKAEKTHDGCKEDVPLSTTTSASPSESPVSTSLRSSAPAEGPTPLSGKVSTVAHAQSTARTVPAPLKTAATLSSFAKRLLAPRAPQQVEVPETIPLNDFILEGFGQEHVHRPTAEDESLSSSDEDEEAVIRQMEGVRRGGAEGSGAEEEEEGLTEGGEDNGGSGVISTCRTLRAWNLWFSSTEETLRAAFGRFGEIERFDMLHERGTRKFRGVLFVTYKKAGDTARALKEMEGARIDNRAVFLAASERTRNRGSLGKGESRYFLVDKALFCRRCHDVGHTMKCCPNPPKARPCTICAALTGHQDDDCPELALGAPEGALCLQCGATDHEDSDCVHRLQAAAALKADAGVRCLSCARLGHGALCGPHASTNAPTGEVGFGRRAPHFVYCFQCGSAGHFGYHCNYRPQEAFQLRRHSYSGTHVRYNVDDPPAPDPPPPVHTVPSNIPQHHLVPGPMVSTIYSQRGRGLSPGGRIG